jgi:TRAP-type C4-dicarboxylate transport system permease large subunit
METLTQGGSHSTLNPESRHGSCFHLKAILTGRKHSWHMNKTSRSDFRGAWALLWRSLVFIPYMLLVFILVGGIWLSRWVLPLYAAVWVYVDEWYMAAGILAAWLLSVWAYRRFRLHRFYATPRSLL